VARQTSETSRNDKPRLAAGLFDLIGSNRPGGCRLLATLATLLVLLVGLALLLAGLPLSAALLLLAGLLLARILLTWIALVLLTLVRHLRIV
jgi:hypothetical protein